jgi:hypothetical protein
MKAFITILLFSIFFLETVSGQSSDVLILKRKDGKRMIRFMQGGKISFLEKSGARYDGKIIRIENDTILIELYDIRRLTTSMGGIVFDTVSRLPVKVDHRDILSVVKPPQSFGYVRNGSLIKWSGIGYGVLHLLNAAISKEPLVATQMAAAGTATAVGYVLGRLYKDSFILGRRYSWQYLDL